MLLSPWCHSQLGSYVHMSSPFLFLIPAPALQKDYEHSKVGHIKLGWNNNKYHDTWHSWLISLKGSVHPNHAPPPPPLSFSHTHKNTHSHTQHLHGSVPLWKICFFVIWVKWPRTGHKNHSSMARGAERSNHQVLMSQSDGEVSGQPAWFISLCPWLARRYKALCWVTYGCNLSLITYTITLTLIRLSLRGGVRDADILAERSRCSNTEDCPKVDELRQKHPELSERPLNELHSDLSLYKQR